MEQKLFNKWNRIVGLVVLAIASLTYLSTIEPTASFWDCGEFIASSYKLEVGHPPGNPVFQLIARFFTIPVSPEHAAMAVNAMNAILSALTIFLLYLTIVFFARKLMGTDRLSTGQAIAVFGSGAVGALAYCFSDTFWFSAVEGEVYAMSSLFTALVFWAMCKWYDQADRPHANRWIVLIAFLMGLSIGVHLLNLLTIPAFVFMYYYRMNEGKKLPFKRLLGIFAIGVVIEFLLVYIFIPYLPKVAAFFDRLFVNGLGLPYNSGALFFLVALLALCFWSLFATLKKGKVFWNTVMLCVTTLVMGFSLFAIVIIRSSVKTPTNEYQPDNAYTLVRYLSREQYGSTPLLYGQYYDAPYDLKQGKYWAPLNGKYIHADAPADADYLPEGKMLFPRMWSGTDPRYTDFYEQYTQGKGTRVKGAKHRKPSFGANMAYFIDYQLNWMYWRYFMWNFVGRQNDIHSPLPGNVFNGNWESGIAFLDNLRLGDQSDAPAPLRENKGKNHYYFLPLLLGLLGLVFQFDRDKRGSWIVFLMFFMTGIAIVVYLNQPPYQVRERDYAYAGSFYMYAVWIGLGVLALYEWLSGALKKLSPVVLSSGIAVLCLGVPALMAARNWDDHDRSHRYTAPEMAWNYLNSVGKNGILVTHGDNDTFPLWYAQEIESVRTDVRVVNTSLLGTDWYIDQMKCRFYDSDPVNISLPRKQYLYGTNDFTPVIDVVDHPVLASEAINVFKDERFTREGQDFIPGHKLLVPVNKDNAIAAGIVHENMRDSLQDYVVLDISGNNLSKFDLVMLDILANYDWTRPICFISRGETKLGLEPWLQFDGFVYRLVPFLNNYADREATLDAEGLYDKLMNLFRFDSLADTSVHWDYQNIFTFTAVIPMRDIFATTATALLERGESEKAEALLDKCIAVMPARNFPYNVSQLRSINEWALLNIVDDYFRLGRPEKALAVGNQLAEETVQSLVYYTKPVGPGDDNVINKKLADDAATIYFNLVKLYNNFGQKDAAAALEEKLKNA